MEDDEGDAKESKCAKTKQGGYEDARGVIRWEVQLLDMGGGAPGRNRGHCGVVRPHEMPLVN